jgi:beta-glucosidase
MKSNYLVLLGIILLTTTKITAQKKDYLDSKKPVEERIDLLMQQMTLEEKVGQMNQYNGFWDITGPTPKDGQAAKKYADLKKIWEDALSAFKNKNLQLP